LSFLVVEWTFIQLEQVAFDELVGDVRAFKPKFECFVDQQHFEVFVDDQTEFGVAVALEYDVVLHLVVCGGHIAFLSADVFVEFDQNTVV